MELKGTCTGVLLIVCGFLFHTPTYQGTEVVSSNATITVGILDRGYNSLADDIIEEVVDVWNITYSLHLKITSLNTTAASSVTLLQYVTGLRCQGVSLLIAPNPCDLRVLQTLPLARIPTVILGGHPLCFPRIPQAADIIFKPRLLTVGDVISHVIMDQYQKVVIIYDETSDMYIHEIVTALEHVTPSAVGLYRKYASSLTIQPILRDLSQPTTYTQDTLFFIWTEPETAISMFKQATRLQLEILSLGCLVHWLAVCPGESSLGVLEAGLKLFSLESLAILHIKNNNLTANQETEYLKSVLDELGEVVNTTIYSGGDPFPSPNSATCQITPSLTLPSLQPSLDGNYSSRYCDHYELYRAVSHPSSYTTLQHVPFCTDDVHLTQSLDLFTSDSQLHGKHLQITTIESEPFVMINKTEGGENFYGIAIDMLNELANSLNFTYTISRVPDGEFGGLKDENNWTGLVGQLQRREVDMSIASLSVTEAREKVMDFVEYYYEYGAAIMKKPDADENKWRVILLPFRWQVWLSLVISVPFAGIIAWGISVLVHRTVKTAKDDFSNPNKSTWYTFGALLTQGGTYLPKSASGRTFICHWWAFSIIVVATYGGSLIAYLTIAKLDAPFDDLDGMVDQSRYKWGFRQGTVYYTAFENSSGGIFEDLWDGAQKFAEDDPEYFSKDMSDHLERLKQGDYVFIMDRTPLMVQMISDVTCTLVVLAENFMPLPFGIGLQKGSLYKPALTKGVKKLRESGLIQFWEKKWWPRQSCSGIPIPESHPVSLMDTQSAFYLLLLGVVIGSVSLFTELIKRKGGIKRVHSQNGAHIINGDIPDSHTVLANGRVVTINNW